MASRRSFIFLASSSIFSMFTCVSHSRSTSAVSIRLEPRAAAASTILCRLSRVRYLKRPTTFACSALLVAELPMNTAGSIFSTSTPSSFPWLAL